MKSETLIDELHAIRQEDCLGPRLKGLAREIADRTMALLFPHFSDHPCCSREQISEEIEGLRAAMRASTPHVKGISDVEIETFLGSLPALHRTLMHDARILMATDPAAESIHEVILAYPGLLAMSIYRIAHQLHSQGISLLPRLLTEHGHRRTGIDIHPAATIGRGLAIDHGTGIVIGATAVIGNNVRLYQGVTLGAMIVERAQAGVKRHPTIEDHVVIYANATILGGDTVIGHDSVVGGNAWITESVPPFSVVGRNSDVRPRRSGTDAVLEFNI